MMERRLRMDNDEPAEETRAELAEDDEQEYELEGLETEDLDDAMREALDAVERSQAHLTEASGSAAEGAEAADVGDSSGDLAELEAELAELRDRSVRTLADFDNYRKRVARERAEERRYAVAELAQDILAVVDNLERAVSSEGSAEDLKQGVGMIQRQLDSILGRHGIQRVAALGEPFDPNLHEAVMRIEDDQVAEPRVSDELQSGYTLHKRLLRPAMVKVAVPVADPAEAAGPETD